MGCTQHCNIEFLTRWYSLAPKLILLFYEITFFITIAITKEVKVMALIRVGVSSLYSSYKMLLL